MNYNSEYYHDDRSALIRITSLNKQIAEALPPAKGSPATLMDSIMGKDIFRWSHVAVLSPVQMAPYRCEPA